MRNWSFNWNHWYIYVPGMLVLTVYLGSKLRGKLPHRYLQAINLAWATLAGWIWGILLYFESIRGIIEFGIAHFRNGGESAIILAVVIVCAYGVLIYVVASKAEDPVQLRWSRDKHAFVREISAEDMYINVMLAVEKDNRWRAEHQTHARAKAQAKAAAARERELEAQRQQSEPPKPAPTKAQRDAERLRRKLHGEPVEDKDWLLESEIMVTLRIPQENGMTQLETMPIADAYLFARNLIQWRQYQAMVNRYLGTDDKTPAVSFGAAGEIETTSEPNSADMASKANQSSKTDEAKSGIIGLDELDESTRKFVETYLEEHPEIKMLAQDNLVRLQVNSENSTIRVKARGA